MNASKRMFLYNNIESIKSKAKRLLSPLSGLLQSEAGSSGIACFDHTLCSYADTKYVEELYKDVDIFTLAYILQPRSFKCICFLATIPLLNSFNILTSNPPLAFEGSVFNRFETKASTSRFPKASCACLLTASWAAGIFHHRHSFYLVLFTPHLRSSAAACRLPSSSSFKTH